LDTGDTNEKMQN